MKPNQKAVRIISQIPKKYHDSTFYIAIVVTLVLLLQLVSLYHDWR